MRKSSLAVFQASILLFSQALLLQVLFYPLVLVNLLKHLPRALKNKKIVFGILLIVFAAISIFMRGSSIPLAITLLRFYCGIILVFGAFYCNKNLKITYVSYWIFILFIGYEYFSLALGSTPFMYANFVNAGIENEIAGRVALENNTARTFGPAMNSSVSGSILAVIFFYILIGSKRFLQFEQKNLPLLVGLFIAFILCGSATASAVFIFLLLVYVFSGSKMHIRKSSFRRLPRLMVISFILVMLAIAFGMFFRDFLDGLVISKLNINYFIDIINYKILQMSVLIDPQMILLGADLSESSSESSGGDFVMLSFVYHFGLIYVVAFSVYLFYACRPENRVFLFAGLLSSMHYGTLFTLTGQVVFGALMAGSLRSKEFLHHSGNLPKSYTKLSEA